MPASRRFAEHQANGVDQGVRGARLDENTEAAGGGAAVYILLAGSAGKGDGGDAARLRVPRELGAQSLQMLAGPVGLAESY